MVHPICSSFNCNIDLSENAAKMMNFYLLEVGKTRLATACDRPFINMLPLPCGKDSPIRLVCYRAYNTVETFKSGLKTHSFEQYFIE